MIVYFLRSIAIVLAGIGFGLAIAEARLYVTRWLAARDGQPDTVLAADRLLGILLVRLGVACMAAYAVLDVGSRLGKGELTFRAPVTLVAFALADLGMLRILRNDTKIQRDYRRQGHPLRRRDDNLMG